VSVICPTITAADARTYRVQIEQVVTFAPRLHIDLADGVLAPTKLLGPAHIWWPAATRADLHVMYKQPLKHLAALIDLRPSLIILHAEAEGDFMEFVIAAHKHNIAVGAALLPETPVGAILPALQYIDHVLIFSGRIGYFGGHADLTLLSKVTELRDHKPQLEIGWDGGINNTNIRDLLRGGIDVLNAGGFIHGAKNAGSAYDTLSALAESA
jgi:ribulose-phosphate 3-epimerase